MIHAPASDLAGDADDWIAHFARLAAAESERKRPGGEVVLERMSEMMFVDLLRRYLQRLPDDQRGWLSGLRDRYVGRVLGLMHEHPAEAWTMEQVADRVGLSRSALHERFVQFIGLTPMQYLTNWRMQIASRLLTQSSATLVSVALDTGYESEAAFSRPSSALSACHHRCGAVSALASAATCAARRPRLTRPLRSGSPGPRRGQQASLLHHRREIVEPGTVNTRDRLLHLFFRRASLDFEVGTPHYA